MNDSAERPGRPNRVALDAMGGDNAPGEIVAGAVLATVAMVLPAASLVLVFARVWERVHMSPWRTAFEHGLAPIAVGLIAASGIIVARGADHTLAQYVLTALATVVFCSTKVQPLVVVGLAGLAGWLGLV